MTDDTQANNAKISAENQAKALQAQKNLQVLTMLRNAKTVEEQQAAIKAAIEVLQANMPDSSTIDQPQAATPTKEKAAATSPMFDRGTIDVPISTSQRQAANNAAIALLVKIEAENLNRDDLSDDEIQTLVRYTGSGGGLTAKNGKRGSATEYYTPKALASSLWALAEAHGFNGGKVLDPSAGTGIFAATSPENAVVDSIELDGVSGSIAKVLNDGTRSNTVVSSFEKQARAMADDSLDMVITNVPFGDNKTRGGNKLDDEAYRDESLEGYFILRSLNKLKPGGLAIFVVPKSVISGRKTDKAKLRQKTSLQAEFLGAYRLPNSVFEQTGADVTTDVVVYRKHSRDALDTIDELYQAGEMQALTDANVFWDEYLSGNYFKKSGKKFVLGEIKETKDRWGKAVETVFSTKPTPEIAKLIQKIGGSCIDWALLDATEAVAIKYQNGDTVFQDGQQLQYKDGVWTALTDTVTDTEREIQEQLAYVGSALAMIENDISYEDIKALQNYSQDTGQAGLLPAFTLQLLRRLDMTTDAHRNAAWRCVLGAHAIEEVIDTHGYGYDYKGNYPELTAYLKTAYLDGKNTKLTGEPKQDHKLVAMYYAAGKYNAVWRGDMDATVDDSAAADSYQSKLARIQYQNKSLSVTPEQLASIYPEIDPLTHDDWFVNHDGSQIIAANDFLVGSLSERLADIDAQIKQATDTAVKAKLERQKLIARENVTPIDVKKLELDLRTPLIGAEDKVRFLKQSVHKDALIAFDAYGKATADIDVKTPRMDTDKLYNRIGDWIANGTVRLGGVKLDSMSERDALNWLSKTINEANIKFGLWVRSSKPIMDALTAKVTDERNLFFSQNDDESSIDIAGMNPKLQLHGYQNAYVRNQGRFFGGINGMQVGLGKTFSALASTQHAHNIGVKKKTLFIVPNSVLSNWRKEATFAYQNTDDAIFVGLRATGDKFRVHSNKYDEDLLAAIDGQYRKVFMTFEAFKRIRLKNETIEDYVRYIKLNDRAYADHDTHKKSEQSKGMAANMIDKLTIKSNAPYLEDMGVDSVVIDEAHAYKNSIDAPGTDSDIKFLSQPNNSARGEDAQAKLFYIRGLSANNDGVQLLSATPITNSPLEIYAMMSLASGRDTVNRMCGGILGADDFIQTMCQIEEEVIPTIDGGQRSQNVFVGIRNAQVLRGLVKANTLIKTADDVGMSVVIPDREETATKVKLDKAIGDNLKKFQSAYSVARMMIKDQLPNDLNDPHHPDSPFNPQSPVQQIMRKYGEDIELVAHPFNLIRKMDVMIADDDFSDMVSFYDFDAKDKKKVEDLLAEFNKKAYNDERKRPSEYTDEDDASPIYVGTGKNKELKGYKIKCRADVIINDGRDRIMVDTLNSKLQARFEAMADKAGVSLNVTVSAKVGAMLDNIKTEIANPRGVQADGSNSKIVKQIIFCDHLFLHNKIKRLLTKMAGIKANKIAIITGQTNNEPDQMIDIQDGFNAESEDNQYQVIIANKKAEVGINLQKGTQAIHHLTTGWTPDSLEQRNGRGARQGNKTEKVAIYHYDADGTFDEFKRSMIDKKDEWISSVLASDGGDNIAVSGGLSRKEQDALITKMGDADAIRAYQESKDQEEVQARREAVKQRQKIRMDIIDEQVTFLRGASADTFLEQAIIDVVTIIRDNVKLYKKINNPDSTAREETRRKNQNKYDNVKAIALDKLRDILAGVLVSKKATDGTPSSIVVPEKINTEWAYNRVLEDSSDFKPSETYYWSTVFYGRVFKKEMGYDIRIAVDENSEYQAMFDEAEQTAKALIENSIAASNKVVIDSGLSDDLLPDEAQDMLLQGNAKIIDGAYVQVGALYLKKGDDSLDVRMIDQYFRGKGFTYRDYQKILAVDDTPLMSSEKKYNPSDAGYVDMLKAAAKAEDHWYELGFLNEDKAIFSKNIPEVAEYRDKSIMPRWRIGDKYQKHAKIENCAIGMMLPIDVLTLDTNFSKAAIKAYEKLGISIDLEDRSFKTSIETPVTKDAFGYGSELFLQNLSAVIKTINEPLTNMDVKIMYSSLSRLIVKLCHLKNDLDLEAVNKFMVETATVEESERMDASAATIHFFDTHVDLNSLLADVYIGDNTKIDIVNSLYYGLQGNFASFLNTYNQVVKKIDTAKNAEKSKEETDEDYSVYINGNTKDHKDTIKDYASRYGSIVSRGRKYIWHGKKKVWIISRNAYNVMIKDNPSLENELTMEKAD